MKPRQLELRFASEPRRKKVSPGFEGLRRLRRLLAAQIEEEKKRISSSEGMQTRLSTPRKTPIDPCSSHTGK